MADFGFGGPRGGIIQTAFTVPDLNAAIDFWINDLKAGPFFTFGAWSGDNPIYRGEPWQGAVELAMGFSGHMLIELMQPLDDHPSVYKEQIERCGYGFHHYGIASADVEADIAAMESKGYTLAFTAGVPTGGNVAFMDGGPDKPGFLELIPANDAMDETFTRFWRASLDWDGSDPIRPAF